MMVRVIRIEVPDWIDEESVRDIVRAYVRLKLPESATRDEFIDYMGIDVKEIVENSGDEELKILDEMRRKSGRRCRIRHQYFN